MENCVIINTNGVAYHPKDVKSQTMTVDELRDYRYDDDEVFD